MIKKTEKYIPAMSFRWLTGIYDTIISSTMPEQKFRTALVEAAFNDNKKAIALEFGVGTASNSILANRLFPNLIITGIDVDDQILSIASKKIQNESLNIELQSYNGIQTELADEKFDVVFSSLVFHHLLPHQKEIAFCEINRLLKPNGKLVFIDWGKPASVYAQISFCALRAFDGWKNTADNASGNYLKMIESAGFKVPKRLKKFGTIYGTLELIETFKTEAL